MTEVQDVGLPPISRWWIGLYCFAALWLLLVASLDASHFGPGFFPLMISIFLVPLLLVVLLTGNFPDREAWGFVVFLAAAMTAAANYAWCNRQVLAHQIREAFEEVLAGLPPPPEPPRPPLPPLPGSPPIT